MGERNAAIPADRRIEFRVGVHQGDILGDGDDILGDGVNIAARLETLSDAGGVCVSSRVHEDLAGRLDLPFEDRGEQQVKNIARPVRVYGLTSQAIAGLPALPPSGDRTVPTDFLRWLGGAVFARPKTKWLGSATTLAAIGSALLPGKALAETSPSTERPRRPLNLAVPRSRFCRSTTSRAIRVRISSPTASAKR
jgi:hypothetical protein